MFLNEASRLKGVQNPLMIFLHFQLIKKKICASVEPEGLSLCSQKFTIGSYHESADTNSHSQTLYTYSK
jgi:hypothetical protein